MRGLIVVLLAFCLAVPLSCASKPHAPDPPDPAGAPPPQTQTDPDPTGRSRLASAIESMIVGATLGSTFGLIGAAAAAIGLGIYGAVTGDVPLAGGRSRGRGSKAEAEDELEKEIEAEIAKQDELEAEIEAERKRQEELLKQIERDEKLREAEQAQAAGADAGAGSVDPREAPAAPRQRELPASIFDEKPREVAKGEWGNEDEIEVVARSLDADRDGAPEEIRYHDQKTGVIVRREEDLDYDGRIDSWTRYDAGLVSQIDRDNDGDGKLDEWQSYGRDGRMAGREVDRDADGTRDACFVYQGGSLVEERHDGNSDGKIDRIVHYRERKITSSEEDLDHDGRIDTFTFFEIAGEREQVSRVERDTNGDGKSDTFETYEQIGGKPSLKQRDEDKNGDNTIDVKSVYENGKLKQREISDPTLIPSTDAHDAIVDEELFAKARAAIDGRRTRAPIGRPKHDGDLLLLRRLRCSTAIGS